MRGRRVSGLAVALAIAIPCDVAAARTSTIEICVHPRRPRLWAFCDASGPLTENEFVRRYRITTGSSALDAFERPRHRRRWAALGTVLGIGVASLAVTIPLGALTTWDEVDTAAALVNFGAMIVVFVGVPTILVQARRGGMRRDGSVWDHDLSRASGDAWRQQYNRAHARLGAGGLEVRF